MILKKAIEERQAENLSATAPVAGSVGGRNRGNLLYWGL